ncbi:hypothetical protein LCGC14_2360400, partial [marine sediment metagenome]
MKPTRAYSQAVGTGLCRALLVMLSVTLVPSAAPAAPADAQQVQPPTDRGVRAAIAKAVAYLYSKQDRQGYFVNPHSREYLGGGEALVALAMLKAGESPEQAKLKRTIGFLKTVQPGHTYTRS